MLLQCLNKLGDSRIKNAVNYDNWFVRGRTNG